MAKDRSTPRRVGGLPASKPAGRTAPAVPERTERCDIVMSAEDRLAQALEQYLEDILEPRLRRQLRAGDIATQEDFDDALLPVAALRGVLDEWEADIRAELGYDALPTSRDTGEEHDVLTPEGRERWIAELSEQLGVTREQLSQMDLDEVFRRIRSG